MTYTKEQLSWLDDYTDDCIINWCHPCGDDYYLYPEDTDYHNEVCEDYIQRIQSDKKFFEKEWGIVISETILDADFKINKKFLEDYLIEKIIEHLL